MAGVSGYIGTSMVFVFNNTGFSFLCVGSKGHSASAAAVYLHNTLNKSKIQFSKLFRFSQFVFDIDI